MTRRDWSRDEVEAIVRDHLEMLVRELSGVRYSKAAHRRRLVARLDGRSESAVEFKHANVSAVLQELGSPTIPGYKPRANYQELLAEAVREHLQRDVRLRRIAEADAEAPIVAPEVDDILGIVTDPPTPAERPYSVRDAPDRRLVRAVDWVEREARNRALGDAGEAFVIEFERARLLRAGRESLAADVEHVAKTRGDHEGFDVLSFDPDGRERFIEVKTTKYGKETPFFASRNEVGRSAQDANRFHLYRLFSFRSVPGLYTLPGSLRETCTLEPESYLAMPA